MPTGDLLTILLTHDRWATRQILDACQSLSPEQFQRPFELGPGSLHDTVAHILGAMHTWTETLAGQPPGPRVDQDGRQRTAAELLALLDPHADALAAEARRRPLDEQVERVLRTGRRCVLTRGAVVTHVTTHGMHHRAQALNMLRQLGVQPLPLSSVAEWTMFGEVG